MLVGAVGALEVGKEVGALEVGEEVGVEDFGDPVDGEFVLGDTVVGANVGGMVGAVGCEDGFAVLGAKVPKLNDRVSVWLAAKHVKPPVVDEPPPPQFALPMPGLIANPVPQKATWHILELSASHILFTYDPSVPSTRRGRKNTIGVECGRKCVGRRTIGARY